MECHWWESFRASHGAPPWLGHVGKTVLFKWAAAFKGERSGKGKAFLSLGTNERFRQAQVACNRTGEQDGTSQ